MTVTQPVSCQCSPHHGKELLVVDDPVIVGVMLCNERPDVVGRQPLVLHWHDMQNRSVATLHWQCLRVYKDCTSRQAVPVLLTHHAP